MSAWSPDDDTARLYARYKRALETERELRDAVKAQAGVDLLAGARVAELAKLTGMTTEVFRRIARDVGAARLKEPTVGKDAKPRTAE